jgi:hypothetical protein
MTIPFEQRPSCSIPVALEATGLKRSQFYELLGRGEVESIKVGSRRLVLVPSLLRLLKQADGTKGAA